MYRNYISTLLFSLSGSGVLRGPYTEGFAVNNRALRWRIYREFHHYSMHSAALEHFLFWCSVNIHHFLSLLSVGH